MSYSKKCLHKFMDMGSMLGPKLGTLLNYKRHPNVNCYEVLNKANIDSSSYHQRLR